MKKEKKEEKKLWLLLTPFFLDFSAVVFVSKTQCLIMHGFMDIYFDV